MEQELADLAAKVAALEEGAGWTTTVNLEVFYWWCTAFMFIIHAGFLAYEMGASRKKNVLASGIKNILAFAFMIPTFFFFGWWIYLAFPGGLVPDFEAGAGGVPWSEAMGPNLTDNATGIFWAAFTLFAATTASIFSGAVIERIKLSGFIMLAILLGSVVWILGASWAWHGDGWLLTQFGWHDFGAAGCVHMVAAFFALGVLINLGPRIGKFNPDGSANAIVPHNVPMATFGLMVLIVGFFGFLGGCIIYMGGEQWVTIFGNPTTLSAIGFNTLMCFAGGIIGGWIMTNDPFWMMSGALAGIFTAASGLDVYWPPLAFLLGFCGGVIAPIGARWLEKMGIDDAVGAVSVHGFAGLFGVLAFGIVASGYPNGDYPDTNFLAQLIGAVTMLLLGLIPGYVASLILKQAGLLRIPENVEILGMDAAKVPALAYPEGMHSPDPNGSKAPAATPAE
ncbi:MAG: ammonium transporter [Pseudomonadota bacterium]